MTDFMSTLPQSIDSVACSALIFPWVSVVTADDSPCLVFPGPSWTLTAWVMTSLPPCGIMCRAQYVIVSLHTWNAYLFSVTFIAPALCSGPCQFLHIFAAPRVPRDDSILNDFKVTIFLGLSLIFFGSALFLFSWFQPEIGHGYMSQSRC